MLPMRPIRLIAPWLLLMLALLCCFRGAAQEPVYHWQWKRDAPLLLGGAALSATGNIIRWQAEPATEQDLLENPDLFAELDI